MIIVLFHLYQKAHCCCDRTRSGVTDGWFSPPTTGSREHGNASLQGATCQHAGDTGVLFHEEMKRCGDVFETYFDMVFPSLRNVVEGVLIAPRKDLTEGALLMPHPEGTLLAIPAGSVSAERALHLLGGTLYGALTVEIVSSSCICHII